MRMQKTIVAAAIFGLWVGHAEAQNDQVAAFYAGKEVTVLIGYPPGGGYDIYARILARHMGDHIPGRPKLVPQNMPGAGSMITANHLYNRAPKDGTVFGLFAGGMALQPLLGDKNAAFDGRKFGWIGSMNKETSLCVAWAASGFASVDDIFKRDFTIGTASSTGTSYAFPTSTNNLIGTKFKLVSGYHGTAGVMLAVERGEVQGMCGMPLASLQTARPHWIENKLINIILQETTQPHSELPNVPTVTDLARDEDTKKVMQLIYGWQIMGRPFTAPPGVPEDRMQALRNAFQETMKDPAFLAEAERLKLDLSPIGASEMEEFIVQAYSTPELLIKRARAAQNRTD